MHRRCRRTPEKPNVCTHTLSQPTVATHKQKNSKNTYTSQKAKQPLFRMDMYEYICMRVRSILSVPLRIICWRAVCRLSAAQLDIVYVLTVGFVVVGGGVAVRNAVNPDASSRPHCEGFCTARNLNTTKYSARSNARTHSLTIQFNLIDCGAVRHAQMPCDYAPRRSDRGARTYTQRPVV